MTSFHHSLELILSPKTYLVSPPHPPALEVVVTDKDHHFNLAKSTCSQSVMKMQSLLYENRMEKVLKKKTRAASFKPPTALTRWWIWYFIKVMPKAATGRWWTNFMLLSTALSSLRTVIVIMLTPQCNFSLGDRNATFIWWCKWITKGGVTVNCKITLKHTIYFNWFDWTYAQK